MNITTDKAKEIMNMLKLFCRKQPNCDDCPLAEMDEEGFGHCFCTDADHNVIVPCLWKIQG